MHCHRTASGIFTRLFFTLFLYREKAERIIEGQGTLNELKVCSNEIAASTAQLVVSSQVKADKESQKLSGQSQTLLFMFDILSLSMTTTWRFLYLCECSLSQYLQLTLSSARVRLTIVICWFSTG